METAKFVENTAHGGHDPDPRHQVPSYTIKLIKDIENFSRNKNKDQEHKPIVSSEYNHK